MLNIWVGRGVGEGGSVHAHTKAPETSLGSFRVGSRARARSNAVKVVEPRTFQHPTIHQPVSYIDTIHMHHAPRHTHKTITWSIGDREGERQEEGQDEDDKIKERQITSGVYIMQITMVLGGVGGRLLGEKRKRDKNKRGKEKGSTLDPQSGKTGLYHCNILWL